MSPTTPIKNGNRRAGPRRRPCSTLQVECRKGTLGLGPNLTRRVLEVSQGGARLLLKVPLAVGDEVEVQVSGYGFRTIKRASRVSWSLPSDDGYLVGLTFHRELPYIDLQRIAKP